MERELAFPLTITTFLIKAKNKKTKTHPHFQFNCGQSFIPQASWIVHIVLHKLECELFPPWYPWCKTCQPQYRQCKTKYQILCNLSNSCMLCCYSNFYWTTLETEICFLHVYIFCITVDWWKLKSMVIVLQPFSASWASTTLF